MSNQALAVVRGVLMDCPRDHVGPVWEPYRVGVKSWAATLTASVPPNSRGAPERNWWQRPRRGEGGYYLVPPGTSPGMAVEFGVNYPEPPEPQPERVGAGLFAGALTIRAVGQARRRFYGVVTAAYFDHDRTGWLYLQTTDGDARKCLLAAKVLNLGPLTPQELELVRGAGAAGDLVAVAILADMLTERGDPRGDELRRGVKELVQELFP